MMNYILQFLVSMVATMAFAVVFSAPKKDLIFCGISGGLGWIFYLLTSSLGGGPTLGNVIGSLILTIFSRALAVARKKPVTLYLITGILPLVPGAGIYYTSYYLIMNDMTSFSSYGLSTIKTAGAIVMGILLGMALPQQLFNKLFGPFGRRS